MTVIETQALTKQYGKARGIQNVSLKVAEGEIYGFIGPNGAGKSTTIKLLLDLIRPTAGAASILGMDCQRQTAQIKQRVGYVPSEVRFYANMTGGQLMETTLAFRHQRDDGFIGQICERLDIDRKKKFRELSMGNKKKIALACAMVHRPDLLILDEPTNGLDPLIQARLFEILKEENARGATIFVSSHNLTEVQQHCTRVAFIKDGGILRERSLEDGPLSGRTVIVTAPGVRPDLFKEIGGSVLSFEGSTLRFTYQGELAPLLERLSPLAPTDLTIRETSLEEEFLRCYGEEESS